MGNPNCFFWFDDLWSDFWISLGVVIVDVIDVRFFDGREDRVIQFTFSFKRIFQNFGLEVQRPVTVPSGHEAEETSIEVV